MTDVVIRRALLSCADKTGLDELGAALQEVGVRMVSTGGTAKRLRDSGVTVADVADVTGHPEVFGGRVKTLHPKIHGGILARLPRDAQEMEQHGIEPFDLVVVNLYRFEEAAARQAELPDLVEEIDIGGPAMLRAAAKSFARVVILTDPSQYEGFLAELRERGSISAASRQALAIAAFAKTAAYDRAIVGTLTARLAAPAAGNADLPERLSLGGERVGDALRYGENPHQRGALYRLEANGLGGMNVLEGGKALSYNNLLDLDAALELSAALPAPAVCVIKHAGPCGAATASDTATALEKAWAGDPLSAFGSVVGCNVTVDAALAAGLIEKGFIEVIVAPGFSDEAVTAIRGRKGWGKNVRLVVATPAAPDLRVRSVSGGLLVQDADAKETPDRWEVVTSRAPSPAEDAALRFGWTCVRFVRSNAIVLAADEALVGVGGGQPSRVDAVEIACKKAGERSQGSVLASDAFFPFPDGIEAAHSAGVTAVVQPGGSKKDKAVIAKADELGVAMIFTGNRHFRH